MLLGGDHFEAIRGRPGPRAFLDGAGPAAIGAILGAAVLLAGALEDAWQWAVLAVAALAARARPLAAARAARGRGRRAAARPLTRLYDHPMADALQEETADVLARLIRFNTVNPPGDERACQEWLRDYLTEAGLECELDGTEPERPNLVATLAGEEPGPVLGYLSHVDTVLADAEDWTHDPWSGEIHDGYLWGRGALDMKSQTAAEAVAAARLARDGWRPATRRAEGLLRRRRGDRRHQGRQVAVREPARPRPRRLPAQRGRRHA